MTGDSMKLYDLALADIDVRPSPWCWLAKFALLHKGVEFETAALRFAEKQNYPDPEYGRLPVLRAGEELICDSAHIIAWLEKNATGPAFVETDAERAATDFYQAWTLAHVFPPLARMLMLRIFLAAHDDDKDYFRRNREERFGVTLEEFCNAPNAKGDFEKSLQTLAAPLARRKFLGGDKPNLSDYVVFSPMMWKRSVTRETLFETPQAVDAWKERMLDLFDGYARNAKSAG
jgi:glutathione S-transferase